MLAVAHAYLTIAAFVVGAVVVVLLVVPLRMGRGRRGFEASPPSSTPTTTTWATSPASTQQH